MYYRRKIILSLLQVFNNQLEKVSLQKLLFLFCKFQQKPIYHFVPFKYGCFSFQANADLSTLTKYSQVDEEENSWIKTDRADYIRLLNKNDKALIMLTKKLFGTKTKEELVKMTYLKYPYYAINSIIANKILTKED